MTIEINLDSIVPGQYWQSTGANDWQIKTMTFPTQTLRELPLIVNGSSVIGTYMGFQVYHHPSIGAYYIAEGQRHQIAMQDVKSYPASRVTEGPKGPPPSLTPASDNNIDWLKAKVNEVIGWGK